MVVQNQHGLHARPCASIVAAMAGFDATVTISRADDPDELGTVDARSIMAVQGLGLRRGEELVARFSGPQAHHAHRDFAELAARNFGDGVPAHQPQAVAQTLGGSPIVELPLCVDVSTYGPGDPQEEAARLERAMAAADGFVEGLAARVPDGSATGAVLRAIRSILADPMLGQGFREEVQDGASAVAAVRTTMAEACRFFETMTNPYLRERGTDLRALERLVLRALVDEGDLTIADVPAGHLVLVEELDAITATQLDPRQVPGVLTRTSGSNGHGLIVARDRGLAVHVVDAG
ncbi:HPr family phosphocarrier protein [Luteococcus sp. Sow4_B9]|uniref:HPr family phosphocarrier protein n=1 Tax=Luteococcus sp. Sow4_B9 TaxID=3438792 RepID=UPI003F992A5A